MSENVETALCVTCGHEKAVEKFAIGDCTCSDCYDKGRSGVNYPEAKATDECETCGEPLEDHGIARLSQEVCFICPVRQRQPGSCHSGGDDRAD